MKITDEMVTAARDNFYGNSKALGFERWRNALEAAIAAAPPSDDYRRGMEDAAREVRALAERIEREFGPCIRSQNVRDADAAIRSLIAIRAAAKGE